MRSIRPGFLPSLFVLGFAVVILCRPDLAFSQVSKPAHRIAFVHIGRVYETYSGTRSAEESIREKVEAFNRIREQLQHQAREKSLEIERLVRMSEDPAQSMDIQTQSGVSAESKLQELQVMGEEYRALAAAQQMELDALRRAHRAEIMTRIQAVIQALAEERGLNAVLDAGKPGTHDIEWVLYLSSELDLTDAVIERLASLD